MRLKATPFKHPDYSVLLEKSQPLALLWIIGHLFMVLYLFIAIGMPFGVMILGLIDPELVQGRAWDLAASCTAAPLLISAIGFAVRLYAKNRGKRLAEFKTGN